MRRQEMRFSTSEFAERSAIARRRAKGLPSGCYPLDSLLQESALAEQLKIAKAKRWKIGSIVQRQQPAARYRHRGGALAFEATGESPSKLFRIICEPRSTPD